MRIKNKESRIKTSLKSYLIVKILELIYLKPLD